jgi:hypothetical protein
VCVLHRCSSRLALLRTILTSTCVSKIVMGRGKSSAKAAATASVDASSSSSSSGKKRARDAAQLSSASSSSSDDEAPLLTATVSGPGVLPPELMARSKQKKTLSLSSRQVYEDLIFKIDGFLLPSECSLIKDWAEDAGFERAYHPATRDTAHRLVLWLLKTRNANFCFV